jgi:hypothetical protein
VHESRKSPPCDDSHTDTDALMAFCGELIAAAQQVPGFLAYKRDEGGVVRLYDPDYSAIAHAWVSCTHPATRTDLAPAFVEALAAAVEKEITRLCSAQSIGFCDRPRPDFAQIHCPDDRRRYETDSHRTVMLGWLSVVSLAELNEMSMQWRRRSDGTSEARTKSTAVRRNNDRARMAWDIVRDHPSAKTLRRLLDSCARIPSVTETPPAE